MTLDNLYHALYGTLVLVLLSALKDFILYATRAAHTRVHFTFLISTGGVMSTIGDLVIYSIFH